MPTKKYVIPGLIAIVVFSNAVGHWNALMLLPEKLPVDWFLKGVSVIGIVLWVFTHPRRRMYW